ncbi:MAG: hypothetical protein P2A85_29335 (plasmid) [Microcoleus anatoxicus]|uniref:hypothetical protein n=1 Tax=Microcoleus anatoxicus TaxID=2705319 RepID=UPI0036711E2B
MLSFAFLPNFDKLSKILIFIACQPRFNSFLDSQFMHLTVDIMDCYWVIVRDCLQYPRLKPLNRLFMGGGNFVGGWLVGSRNRLGGGFIG